LGTELEVAGGSSGLTTNVYGAVFFDFVPWDELGFALGPVVGESYGMKLPSSPGACDTVDLTTGRSTCSSSPGTPTTFVAGAARVNYFAWNDRSPRGARRGLDFGLEVQVGGVPKGLPADESSAGVAAYVSIGYAVY
jgi:hypothetical protein